MIVEQALRNMLDLTLANLEVFFEMLDQILEILQVEFVATDALSCIYRVEFDASWRPRLLRRTRGLH